MGRPHSQRSRNRINRQRKLAKRVRVRAAFAKPVTAADAAPKAAAPKAAASKAAPKAAAKKRQSAPKSA